MFDYGGGFTLGFGGLAGSCFWVFAVVGMVAWV